MRSIIRTIMVLVFFGFAMAGSALARRNIGEAHVEAGADTVESIGSTSATAPPPPPSPPGASFAAVNVEPSVGTIDNLVASAAGPTSVVSFVSGTSSPGTGKVLVIPSAEIKTEDVSAITQDMKVMSHIFNKIFKGPRLIEGVFVDYGDFFGRGSRATQSIYLQGFGTLFVMEVDFPFSPPDESKAKPEETKEGDSVWNQAKKEMFFPTTTANGTRAPAEMYNAEKVEELKTRLIKALKHAANIRNLKSDEQIILTVIGKSRSYGGGGYGGGYGGGGYGVGYGGGAANVSRSYSRTNRRGYSTTRIVPGGISISSNTVLTIRAKKSDVDAFAKGDLDYEKFREKVQILKYYSLGQNAGGVSFTRKRIELPPPPDESVSEPTEDVQF